MRKFIILVIFSISLASCALVGKFLSGNFQNPKVSYKSFGMGKIDAKQVELIPGVYIENPNDVDIPIEKIDYKLNVNSKTMVEGFTHAVGLLPANKTKPVDISLLVTKDSLESLKDLFLSSEKVDYQALLNIKVNPFNVPFELKGSIYKPSIKFAGIHIDEKNSSFQKLSGNIQLTVENKNSFSLPLKDIHYSVTSGKNKILAGKLEGDVEAESSSILNLPFSVNPAQISGSLLGLLGGKLPLGVEISTPFGDYNYSSEVKI